MTKKLTKNYRKFLSLKKKKRIISKFFRFFLPEVVYRSTKIEHPNVSKRDIFHFLNK